MFRAQITGNTIVVFNFSYKKNERGRKITQCHLRTENSVDWQFVGESILHPEDQFVKAIGRKAALRKVITRAGLDRDSRKAVWNAYFAKTKPGLINSKQLVESNI